MPFFCVQMFDFCVSCLTVVGYFSYAPDMKLWLCQEGLVSTLYTVIHQCVFTIPVLFADFQLIRAQVLFIPEQIYSEAVCQH